VNRFRTQPATLLLFATLLAAATPAEAQNASQPSAARKEPPEVKIEKELVSEDEVKDWRKNNRQTFTMAMYSGKLNSQTQPGIEEGIRMLVHELSLKSRRDTLSDARKKILREIDPNAKGQQMREFVMGEIIKRATELLDGNYHVRMHAVLLISELNIDPGQFPRKPPVAHVNGVPTLLDIVDAPQNAIKQPVAVRVLAARGIARLLHEGRQTLPANQKLTPEVAGRVLSQLTRRNDPWYTQRLMDALIETALQTVSVDGNPPRPLIVEALARLMTDTKQPYSVRTHACYCLGRTPMPGGINAAPVGWSISQLASQIATDINQGKVNGTQGYFLLQTIYLGFQADTQNEKTETTTDGRNKAGLVNSLPSQPIQNAYRDFLPLFNGVIKLVINGNRVIVKPEHIQTLRQVQKPQDLTLVNGGPEIIKPMTPPNPPAQAGNPTNPGGKAQVNQQAG
jgi:hypothetical protein